MLKQLNRREFVVGSLASAAIVPTLGNIAIAHNIFDDGGRSRYYIPEGIDYEVFYMSEVNRKFSHLTSFDRVVSIKHFFMEFGRKNRGKAIVIVFDEKNKYIFNGDFVPLLGATYQASVAVIKEDNGLRYVKHRYRNIKELV